MPSTRKTRRDQDTQATGVRDVTQEALGSEQSPTRSKPRMPHERDEGTGEHSTSGIDNAESADVIRQAREDIESGQQDTDRGPVTDRTYHELRKKK
jgi:hypothetical protein